VFYGKIEGISDLVTFEVERVNSFPTVIRGLRVIVVNYDKITAERAVVVGIRFSVRNHIELSEPFLPSGLEHAGQQFIFCRIIVIRFWKRNPVSVNPTPPDESPPKCISGETT